MLKAEITGMRAKMYQHLTQPQAVEFNLKTEQRWTLLILNLSPNIGISKCRNLARNGGLVG